MTRYSIIVPLSALLLLASCDDDFPYESCPCHTGGNGIGGWENGTDSTLIEKKDSIGGFDVTVDEWGNTIKTDVPL